MATWFASLTLGAKIGVGIAIATGAAAVLGGGVTAAVLLTAPPKYDCVATDTSERKCGVVKGGRYKSLDECQCFGAVTDAATGACACTFAPTASKTYATEAACFADAEAQCGWTYMCDPASSSPARCTKRMVHDGFPNEAACKCVFPQGGELLPVDQRLGSAAVEGGPTCTCATVTPDMQTPPRFLFSTMDECKLDETYKCGWKYELPSC